MSYDRVVFTFAAAWNLVVAAMLLTRPSKMLARMGITDPAACLLARSFVSSVATWGLAYAMIAIDPTRFRDFAWLGAISKSLYFTINTPPFIRGRLSRQAFLPAILDLLLAALFLEFLWRTH
jgi:hypothetical protein